MANTATISATLFYDDSASDEQVLQIVDLSASIATGKYIKHKQSIGTSEEAIVLGECTSPGWCMFINRDSTNFITLKVATSGAIFAKLLPGEFALLRLGSGAQVPFAIADTATCILESLILQT
jgi:hypothetical protein